MINNNKNNQVKPGSGMSRKTFLKQSSLSLAGLGLFPLVSSSLNLSKEETTNLRRGNLNKDEKILRSITYNVFNGCIGYKGINGHELPEGVDNFLIKSARDMRQIPQRIMLELALYEPDIINFSESPNEEVVAQMAKMFNLKYAFFPGAKDGLGHFPGSILTNYEIISSESRPFLNKSINNPKDLFTRHWGKAKLKLPNGKMISVHSAHLWPFNKEANDVKIRLNEIKELMASIKYDLNNQSDYVLLQGDLNHTPDTMEYKTLNDENLVDVFKVAGKGNGHTVNAIKPVRRIDYIYASKALSENIVTSSVLFEGNFRMNKDDPNGFALSDHLPVIADFQLS